MDTGHNMGKAWVGLKLGRVGQRGEMRGIWNPVNNKSKLRK